MPVAASIPLTPNRDSISKACARNTPLNSIRAARTVPVAGSWRQIKGSAAGRDQVCVRLALSGNPIGVAEAAGLHFLHGSVDSRCGRAAEFSGVHNQRWSGAAWNLLEHRQGKVVQ